MENAQLWRKITMEKGKKRKWIFIALLFLGVSILILLVAAGLDEKKEALQRENDTEFNTAQESKPQRFQIYKRSLCTNCARFGGIRSIITRQ